MKIQCPCGAKYAFDVTPEMADQPVQFVCENCGLDFSDFVNGLIRQELGLGVPAEAPPPAAPDAEVPLRLHVAPAAQPAGQAGEPRASSDAPQFCLKHRGEVCAERCVVCQKPICPKCMELFGYVCSPLCKAKAEARKIKVPVYAGQKTVVEAQFWRKTGIISGAIAAGMAALLGCWFWYAWFGSVPHPIFSVRFTDAAHSGQAQLCGKGQLVLLHGGTLARYDIPSKKEIWSHQLIDRQQIKDAAAREAQAFQEAEPGARGQTPAKGSPTPPDDETVQSMEQAMAAELQLQVAGSNVWVRTPGKLTHYDWGTGRVLQEIPLAGGFGEMVSQGDELLMTGESETGQPLILHINPASGESRTETISQPGETAVAMAGNKPGKTVVASARGAGGSPSAGLPLVPGADIGKPLDPGKVAQQAQSLPAPARIALPALVANSMHQERIMQEASDNEFDEARFQQMMGALASGLGRNRLSGDHFSLVLSQYGNLQYSVRIVQTNIVTREAMKAPPARSALDSDKLNANELLNEMQRNRGGSTVDEDESRYQVKIRRPDSTADADWTGEVTGPPALFSLKTVNVLTSGKYVTVFDKTNKKLWQATLAYHVPAGSGILGEEGAFGGRNSEYGEGPCVERGDTLYVFDQATLTAFDLANGNVRWRLPSVGIAGLFFDDQGMLYVNSTTASPENIKYSKQIDISQKTDAVFLKINPKTGKTLWSMNPGCPVSYLSGKFIYAIRSSGGAGPEDKMAALAGIASPGAFLRIRRFSPTTGRMLWDYQQSRAPLYVQFHGNMIELVFRKEVQVLKCLSL